MSHKSQNFEILCDSRSPENQESAPPQSQPLRHLSISQSQNRQSEQGRKSAGIHELDQFSRNPHWGVIKKNTTTFEVLSTVDESESQSRSVSAESRVPDNAQQVLQLPVGQYSSHPLSVAARNIPPLEDQLAKHRSGLFEWILAVRIPGDSKSQDDRSEVNDSKEAHKVYFGCTLLPEPPLGADGISKKPHPVGSCLLLVTSLEETKDVLEVFSDPVDDTSMALPEANSGHSTPLKTSDYNLVPGVSEGTPNSTLCTRGDDSMAGSITPRSPGNSIARIEDSFEALDILEDQLEAFDTVARFNRFVPAELPPSKQSTGKYLAASSSSVRFATPQPQRTFTRPTSASLREKSASEPRRTALRKVTSMNLDPHKFKAEDKTAIQSAPRSIIKGNIGLPSQRFISKSTKQGAISTYELPGETTARQLKERQEARLASQRATQPTVSSLRRAKSAKLPTRPTFELPGEAISRRKREEHQAQLRAQEEEERRRREFKARPVPSYGMPATMPRETIASRARQNKPALTENSARTHTPKHPVGSIASPSRAALSTTINQSQSRGREPKIEGGSTLQVSRATSTSTTSLSGKRSSLSIEDVQMQKLRGHEIYQRDNSWADSRMREKSQREALAKLAREEAAERSRQKSREWAAKQARKRLTIGPVPDTTA
ncbi:hypothetical protein O1611_g2587 [Lasiodiplodia mahajangana]|uniref:Uncharacterized protein n=1 Tax=Lasiodiplodia mahajangana TaxID=1108764 RepID=A0ACC2JV10_9PEZI|nr:hypothetical protein O1611_g2587 [Lasiodiplodia mahajangana]